MGRYIAKLGDDAYCEWSTVVDAPVSWVVPREQAVKNWTEGRVALADTKGTSEEIAESNRAGRDESRLTVAEIIEAYDAKAPADWTQ